MFSPCNADARFACIVGHRQTGHWNIVNFYVTTECILK